MLLAITLYGNGLVEKNIPLLVKTVLAITLLSPELIH